ncbi:MAG: 1-(5-phosphoribosyl)-5-[(5-phosphoribosylamino)methylideneamino]imidazole-4-carboxamide isomerase [Chloroherpetonaceae bacterium]|nr:1-(5-phosphoribosyl)-5-[(5-phosphoribosylamino)methylideneamino]imidazole-4-carboxamide isomerase [Chloroherpetonaceae bacterium]MDW8437172.1 1-(5-phosphoribosyl)-5-[(5-phosphoribosylamino)methylideneamino]imidazole-4-carboxamide isomerase [Chloroherpetonaceae bacterium]
MLVIPAIDIRGGKCVRLTQGDYKREKIYLDCPCDMAIVWRKQNAKMLHLVDLDAAKTGKLENFAEIKRIVETLDIPIEVGGGIRSLDSAKAYFDIGVYRVVIGSAAVTNPKLVEELLALYGPKKVVVGIDAENGVPKVHGWLEGAAMSDVELGLKMKALGVERVIYTDISKDGALAGVGYDAIKRFAENAKLRVTASGGVSSYKDLTQLATLAPLVDSVIIGKALYEETFPCQKLWHLCEKEMSIDTNFSTASMRPCASA